MADREKVIKGLELCSTYDCNRCDNCPYGRTCGYGCDQTVLIRDALALLKEQWKIIEQYHRADSFLDAHGWKW